MPNSTANLPEKRLPANAPRMLNVPMWLTWARIAMIPVIIGVFYLPETLIAGHWKNAVACALFSIAAITDAVDGWYARRYGPITQLGAFLDPVADDVASLGLDLLLRKEGFHRGSANPFLLGY